MSMDAILDAASWVFLSAGGLLAVIGGIGIVRFPDVFTRSHAAGMTDTGGAGLILIGLMLQGGASLVTVKLFLILVFIFFTSPTATFALVHTAHVGGEAPRLDHDLRDRPPDMDAEPGERDR